jgi:hypothetical protein
LELSFLVMTRSEVLPFLVTLKLCTPEASDLRLKERKRLKVWNADTCYTMLLVVTPAPVASPCHTHH